MPFSSIESNAPATLLIVDDDNSAREGLRSIFETAGHKTITANDAPAALRLLRHYAGVSVNSLKRWVGAGSDARRKPTKATGA